MKPLTEEWIAKAEGDFATAGRELRARKSANYDAVCFHAQQCAEKYLKAVLQEKEIEFGFVLPIPRNHPAIAPSAQRLRHRFSLSGRKRRQRIGRKSVQGLQRGAEGRDSFTRLNTIPFLLEVLQC